MGTDGRKAGGRMKLARNEGEDGEGLGAMNVICHSKLLKAP
jgi:hypothetical protein